jgi:uncharacterized protein (TIGR02466 family)
MTQLQHYWPTPILRKVFPEAASVNSELIPLFYAQRRESTEKTSTVYSSPDDLLSRYTTPSMQQLFGFISQSVFEIASSVNGHIWQRAQAGRLQMHVVGAWFQIQNHYGFHDIHSHGNCSWSGVYYLQIDPPETRTRHPNLGEMNGVTRFYSPRFDLLGGAHIDLGNAYLQESHIDIIPEEGTLIVFPSWLNHKAMPYDGEKDRIIISFNAQVHGEQGDKSFEYGF